MTQMLLTREELEARERTTLAPYSLQSGDTKGREYPDAEPEHRTPFQRDRDRIMHTTAFRRLGYKTQVFVNHEGDYYRTRLTHTLEVAQIGRTVARMLGVNEDLVEAICLAHDLGHPPFGHSGETALNRLMEGHGGFDHNRNSYRIVTAIEHRYPKFPGLNLTYEVREGIVKHETEYDISDATGYEPDKRASLEAQIANIADELTYTAHDLDDGLYSTLITPAQLDKHDLALWEMLKEQLGFEPVSFSAMERHKAIRRLVGILVRDVAQATHKRIEAANPSSPDDIQKLDHNVIGHSEEMAKMTRQLKDFLYANMYRHFRVVRMAEKASRFLTDLFNAYMKEPMQLPTEHFRRYDVGDERLPFVVTDYIAGMTDRYALEEYDKLFDPHSRA